MQNSKLLHAIDGTRSAYPNEELAKSAAEHAQHSRRLSNFRGPESARYVNSPFHVSPTQPKPGRLSSMDPLRPHTTKASMLFPLGASGSPSFRNGMTPEWVL
ncbi:hypothetical protein DUNSADRAFT_4388 [Dunaliella salina]|uniref:Encoded protein n=1 Tax=Dunaliella salina TaxID=3046 RepID=A0ABQ7FUU3_DUNSA|nr:hypothetical protein DUNSADRAFT_4388 [Dunaliella salina]|eukprot:KAF5826176.1 hypothetical protein DUNSADRAFT_4388 [Dunaliella salina]